jgi:adenosylcobinamide amidohydrolase
VRNAHLAPYSGGRFFDKGLHFTGTTSDAIIVSYEKSGEGEPILYSGPATPFGGSEVKLVRLGVKDALKAHYGSDDVETWRKHL